MEGHLFHVYSHVYRLDRLHSAQNMTVILVQVNPGETFTIRAEDGSLQCIQGESRFYCIVGALFTVTVHC
ncbi:unnamed protein product [Boreogadus saida]